MNSPNPAAPLRVDEAPPGTHMCLIYKDVAVRAAAIGRFLAGGFTRDGAVGYLGDLDRQGPIARRLAEAGIDLAAAAARSQRSSAPTPNCAARSSPSAR